VKIPITTSKRERPRRQPNRSSASATSGCTQIADEIYYTIFPPKLPPRCSYPASSLAYSASSLSPTTCLAEMYYNPALRLGVDILRPARPSG
jgi:hypothetical protein